MQIILVSTHKIDEIWPKIVHHFESALQYGSHNFTSDMFFTLCRSGQGFLFVTKDLSASMVLNYTSRNNERVANLLVLGGDKPVDWEMWIDKIGNFVYQNGVRKVIAEGRPGLQKVVHCLVPKHVVYEVDLEDGRWRQQQKASNDS